MIGLEWKRLSGKLVLQQNKKMKNLEHQALLEFGYSLITDAEPDEDILMGRVTANPLRSILYVPGNRREWIQKCHRFGSDAIVLDLEDSVPYDEKAQARIIISEEIGALSKKVQSVWVRINAELNELEMDLEAAMVAGISVIQLPKVFSANSVIELDRKISWHEGKNGIVFGKTIIAPILETAGGIKRAYDIAVCSKRVEYLGAIVAPEGDTARALRMTVMSDSIGTESLYAREKVVVDARAAGIKHVIGGTVTDLSPDQSLLKSFTSLNKSMGYSGTLLIHPSHVPFANELFKHSYSEVQRAREVLQLLKGAGGRAAIRNPATGQMIDLAHARHAYWVLKESDDFSIN